MKIGFDARMIDHPGIGRYINNLLNSLIDISGDEFNIYGEREKLFVLNKKLPTARVKDFRAPIYSIQEMFFSPLCSGGNDVCHIPHFNVPLRNVKNLVITIHDLIYLKFPEASSRIKNSASKFLFSNALRKATKIIAVSQNTKKDIIEYFPFAARKIEVIYEACDPMFRKIEDEKIKAAIRRLYNLPEKIILFVGSLRPHKNIERLIDAYDYLKVKGIEHRLVIVGRADQRRPAIIQKIKQSDALYLGEIPSDHLAVLHNIASLLAVPSVYEGFGLPAVEAMVCGVPVVASDTSSLPEVIGEAGLFFKPYDIRDMADKIYTVLSDEKLRQKLIEKGLKRAREFSWEKTALKTLAVYNQVAGYRD